jgi:hypothetical protein
LSGNGFVNFSRLFKGVIVKKSISTIAASSLFVLSSVAFAAGPYDGIYQSTTDSNDYVSLHQSGNSVIIANFSVGAVTGVTLTGSFGTIGPRSLDTWELYQGTMTGTHGSISGEGPFRACNTSWSLDIDAAGNANATLTGVARTASGTAQNVNCGIAISIGTVVKFNRVF